LGITAHGVTPWCRNGTESAPRALRTPKTFGSFYESGWPSERRVRLGQDQRERELEDEQMNAITMAASSPRSTAIAAPLSRLIPRTTAPPRAPRRRLWLPCARLRSCRIGVGFRTFWGFREGMLPASSG